MIDEEFKEWACLKSGCNGGNPKAKIVFCGLEWAEYIDPNTFNIANEISKLKNNEPEIESMDTLKSQSTFDQNLIKLLHVCITGSEITKDTFIEFKNEYHPFTKDSDFFKMNLYPIPFQTTDSNKWNDGWYKRTGLQNKDLYKLWCWQNRFPNIRKWAESARLIICVGKSYYIDFLNAFSGIDNINFNELFISTESVIDEDKIEITYTYVNNGRTLLCVTPFLTNPGNLVGNIKIQKYGTLIRRIYEERYNEPIEKCLTTAST